MLNIVSPDPNRIIVRLVERRGRANEYHELGLRLLQDGRQLETRHMSFARVRRYVSCS
jgi:hypothetical protein